MSGVDIVGAVGDLLSWIGLLAGIPLLVIAVMIRVAEGSYSPTRLTVMNDLDEHPFALWTAGGRTCSRALTEHEQVGLDAGADVTGFVSARDPERMRLEKTSRAVRVCLTLAVVMLGAAALGFIASLLPLLA